MLNSLYKTRINIPSNTLIMSRVKYLGQAGGGAFHVHPRKLMMSSAEGQGV